LVERTKYSATATACALFQVPHCSATTGTTTSDYKIIKNYWRNSASTKIGINLKSIVWTILPWG
jgi:hypothetical protein